MVSSCCKWHNDCLINTYFCLCAWRNVSTHFQFKPTSFISCIVFLILRLSTMSQFKESYELQSAFPSLESLQDDNLLASQRRRRRLVLARKDAVCPVSISQTCWDILVTYTVGCQEGKLTLFSLKLLYCYMKPF